MKPAPFEYVAVSSVAEGVRALSTDEGAKVIAGGQSLMPLLALRLARPTLLVDINRLALEGFTVDPVDSTVRVGALVRHRRLELDPFVSRSAPLLAAAAPLIGYPAIRNRGTIGGSLAHADPVAELPAVLLALDGSALVTGAGGDRSISALELFQGFLTTALAPDEIIVEVRLPAFASPAERQGAAFCEWAPRTGDFAVAGVGVAVAVDSSGMCVRLGAAACGIGSTPLLLSEVIGRAGVIGAMAEKGVSDALLRAVAADTTRACTASDGDRAELAGLLAARAVSRAFHHAGRHEAAAA
jgi:carbon-monoxide dehydrogenase medium subunit